MPKESNSDGVPDQAGELDPQKPVLKQEPCPENFDDGDGDICSPRQEPSTEDDKPLP